MPPQHVTEKQGDTPHHPPSYKPPSTAIMNGAPPQWDYLFFLSPSAAKELPQYQYKGEDLSLLYYYILSPLAAFCVNHLTPRTVAPNTITLTGLAFMVASYTAMWYYVPDLEPNPDDEPPRWIFLFNGIAILIYQTLDNMDGKQARRTRSSSPLGLLFDHGCDAVNSLFGSANWIVAMGLHPRRDSYLCWSMLFGPYALFFIGTWEEYFTGKLVMPLMNGPNEGLLGAALMSFTSWYCGPAYWHGYDGWSYLLPVLEMMNIPSSWLPESGLRNADLLVLASCIGFVQETGIKTIYVAYRYGVRAVWKQLPFLTLCICSLVIGWTDLDVWLDNPRTSLHLCAALFVDMTADLMLAHVTKQDYRACRWTLLPLVVLTVAILFEIDLLVDPATYLLVYATAETTYLLCKAFVVIHEICAVLNVWCFDIVTPRRRHAALPNGAQVKTE